MKTVPFIQGRIYYRSATVLLCILLPLITSCMVRSSTTYVKAPFPASGEKPVRAISSIGESARCLDTKLIEREFDNSILLTLYAGKKQELMTAIASIIAEEGLACPKKNLWTELEKDIRADHEGLLETKIPESHERYASEFRDAINTKASHKDEISLSFARPASLSLSARALPSEQEPGGAFAGLKERAQAALIDYAGSFARAMEKKGAPKDEAASLLVALSRSPEPRLADTQKFELTISSVLNSASVDDRFDYIAAYLTIAPLQTPNGRISLEHEFIRKIAAMGGGRPQGYVSDAVNTDIRRALEGLRIRFEVIDALKLEAKTFQLGTLESTADLSAKIGATAASNIKLTEVGTGVTTKRSENISKELDKRAYWIDPTRTVLRITQRGMQEATISGSFSEAITLKIPKTKLYVIDIDAARDQSSNKIAKVNNISLKDVEQPLYANIEGLGVVLGTVRASIPFRQALTRKEPDGLAYTVVQDPLRLSLWKNDRILTGLILQELLPELKGRREGVLQLAIGNSIGDISQVARFSDRGQWESFIETLLAGKLFLREDIRKTGWYLLAPCQYPSEKELEELLKQQDDQYTKCNREEARKRLCDFVRAQYEAHDNNLERRSDVGLHSLWLGHENAEGRIQGFPPDLKEQLRRFTQCLQPKIKACL